MDTKLTLTEGRPEVFRFSVRNCFSALKDECGNDKADDVSWPSDKLFKSVGILYVGFWAGRLRVS